ncbi:MAG: hypothetical protein JWN11_1682 [Hyphomicrobiales bacterium]|nr:hypothetical protein [Hyphomicrobiales bacterium]
MGLCLGERMEFEWDEEKNRANIAKHGIAFEDAAYVFDDPFALIELQGFVDSEERWQAIGSVNDVQIFFVAYTHRDEFSGHEVVRMISARRANRLERQRYERQIG